MPTGSLGQYKFDLKGLFPCKKLRRSNRLELKEKTETRTKTISQGPLGYFELLPLEVKLYMLSFLTIEDLSLLTISSKAMRNLVELYRSTTQSRKHFLCRSITHTAVEVEHQDWFIRQFERLGLLMKRSTCLYATKDRLRIILHFLQKYLCSDAKKCESPYRCIALVCYGKFLHMVLAGWDDKECQRTYDTITTSTCMAQHLDNLLHKKPGIKLSLEIHVRLFYRRVFVNPCTTSKDTAFWLSQILKKYPIINQARLIFLLFGPVSKNEIQWFDLCERIPVTKEQALKEFGDLASALQVLYMHSEEVNYTADLVSIIDELISVPDDWLMDNIAHLLYLCGNGLTLKLMISKAVNGRMMELANLITSLCMVCIKHKESAGWVTNLVYSVCLAIANPKDKLVFLYSIADGFKDIILELHDFSDPDEEHDQDIQTMMEAQAEFTKQIMLLAYKSCM